MAVKLSDDSYRGILYDFVAGENGVTVTARDYSSSTSESYDYNVSGYKTYNREPGTVSYDCGKNYDGTTLEDEVNTIGLTQTTLQDEYDAMVNSVATNGGFYVARYELSYNNGGQSQRGKKVASAYDNTTKMWYGLYDACRNMYNTINYQSMMISGSQYDQIMLWMKQNGQGSYVTDSTGKGNYEGATKATGRKIEYNVMNVYDLAGNLFEWTSEAEGTTLRVIRGGTCNATGSGVPASYRYGLSPFNNYDLYSSRVTLYIR